LEYAHTEDILQNSSNADLDINNQNEDISSPSEVMTFENNVTTLVKIPVPFRVVEMSEIHSLGYK
jgi:hypothetical protein